eukprot:GHRQ01017137.1.p2 GENE.GHRQ01017137.1~~GHRQ01017137.1.p2  ORF type:complete len:133 (+),score=31.29 GHRQ01017137.1:649-1047(+)
MPRAALYPATRLKSQGQAAIFKLCPRRCHKSPLGCYICCTNAATAALQHLPAAVHMHHAGQSCSCIYKGSRNKQDMQHGRQPLLGSCMLCTSPAVSTALNEHGCSDCVGDDLALHLKEWLGLGLVKRHVVLL